jgi:hypothetical protein
MIKLTTFTEIFTVSCKSGHFCHDEALFMYDAVLLADFKINFTNMRNNTCQRF